MDLPASTKLPTTTRRWCENNTFLVPGDLLTRTRAQTPLRGLTCAPGTRKPHGTAF
jgi:hypothetical protein